MSELLQGVRVIEMGILFNGDAVGMHLGDLGADVIKLESPVVGDYLRDMHGHLAPGWSPTHIQTNKNKRSLTLDVRTDAGREAFWKLLDTADVFVDGLSTTACERMGIGYEEQRRRNPRIVYCQHSGFGATGPLAGLPTHGIMPVALAGGAPQELGPDGRLRPSAPKPDAILGGARGSGDGVFSGALFSVVHILAALLWRTRTGQGTHIDVASSDASLAMGLVGLSVNLNLDRLVDLDGVPPSNSGTWRGAKYQYYETADQKVLLFCCMERKFWEGFCRAVGRDDLSSRNDGNTFDYGEDDEALRREVQDIMRTRTLVDWVEFAVDHDLPIGPAHSSIEDVKADPQVRSRQVIHEGHHPAVGAFTYLGQPAIVEGHPFRVRLPAPAHGEHTDEVLHELGYDAEEVAALRASGVV